MCLIAIKNKGIPLNSQFFTNLSRSYHIKNNDGGGYGILRNGKKEVEFKKGYFHIEDLINAIKNDNVQLNDILVVHLRKTSAGIKSIINCHPFVMDISRKNLNRSFGRTKKGLLFHNGTFISFHNYYSKYSDTYEFVRYMAGNKGYIPFLESITQIKNLNRRKDIVKKIFGENKLVILHPLRGLLIINQTLFHNDINGFIYSNDSYTKEYFRANSLKISSYGNRNINAYANQGWSGYD